MRTRQRKKRMLQSTREACTLSMATLSRIKGKHPHLRLVLHQEYQRTPHQANSLRLKFAEHRVWQNICFTTSEARWRFRNLPSSRPMLHTQHSFPTCTSNCTRTTRACMKQSSKTISWSSNKKAERTRSRRWTRWQSTNKQPSISSSKRSNQFYCQL